MGCGMAKKPQEQGELHSNAWERFERAVDDVVKSPPQHRAPAPKPTPKPKKSPQRKKPAK